VDGIGVGLGGSAGSSTGGSAFGSLGERDSLTMGLELGRGIGSSCRRGGKRGILNTKSAKVPGCGSEGVGAGRSAGVVSICSRIAGLDDGEASKRDPKTVLHGHL